MAKHMMVLSSAQSRSVCSVDAASYCAFMRAACYFSVLRFYFYYFSNSLALSERVRIS